MFNYLIQYSQEGLLWVALLFNIFLFGITQDACCDVWSHALHGRILVEEGKYPKFSDYSCVSDQDFTLKVNYIIQVVLYLFLKYFGYPGLLLFKSLVLLATCVFIIETLAIQKVPLALSIGGCLLLLLVGYPRFFPRADFLNLPFFVFYCYTLERYSVKPGKFIYLLIVIQILWINLHALACTGIALIGLYALVCHSKHQKSQGNVLLFLAATCLLASCLHPEGTAVILAPFKVISSMQHEQTNIMVIMEFLPLLELRCKTDFLIFCYFGIIAIVALLLLLNWQKSNWHYAIVFAIMVYSSLKVYRFLGMFAMYSAFLLPLLTWQFIQKYLPPWIEGRRKIVKTATIVSISALHLLTGITLLTGHFFRWNHSLLSCKPFVSNKLQPVDAVKFLQHRRFRGNIYVDYALGGYVGYYLYPAARIFIHSLSTTVYSMAHFEFYSKIAQGKIHPDTVYFFYKTEVFLVYDGKSQLTQSLYLSPNWRLLYVDGTMALFGHKESPFSHQILDE